MQSLKRVMIIGQPGSGKSTLARRMGDITGLPVIHIDKIHWQPGWIERENSEKDRLCAEVCARECWIFEGGRSVNWPQRLARADMLIWLDVPFAVRVWRVFKRTIRHYGQSRPDLPKDCPERFNWEFSRWIWDTRHTGRENMRRLYESAPSGKSRHRLTTAADVSRFLRTLSDAD